MPEWGIRWDIGRICWSPGIWNRDWPASANYDLSKLPGVQESAMILAHVIYVGYHYYLYHYIHYKITYIYTDKNQVSGKKIQYFVWGFIHKSIALWIFEPPSLSELIHLGSETSKYISHELSRKITSQKHKIKELLNS